MGYVNVWEHYGDDGYPSNEDLYSLELDFTDTWWPVCHFDLWLGS